MIEQIIVGFIVIIAAIYCTGNFIGKLKSDSMGCGGKCTCSSGKKNCNEITIQDGIHGDRS